MKVVIDTNVFVSGVFFSGPPYQVLNAWRKGTIELVISPEILEEYVRTGEELARKYSAIDLAGWMQLILTNSKMIHAPALKQPVCSDSDDDKFIACAVASGAKIIVTGDKALLAVSGYRKLNIMSPRRFVESGLI